MNNYFKKLLWINLAVLITCTGHATAQDGASSATEYKIGIVDMQIILKDNKHRKEQYDLLQVEVDKLQEDLTSMSDAIEADKEKFKNLPTDGTADEERRTLKDKIESDYLDYQTEMEKRQRSINSKEEKILKDTLEKIKSAINKVAVTGNYHLILSAKGGPNSVVLYHSPTIEITSKVQTALNGH